MYFSPRFLRALLAFELSLILVFGNGCGGQGSTAPSTPPTTGTLSVSAIVACGTNALGLTIDGVAVSGATCAGYTETGMSLGNHTLNSATVAGFTMSGQTLPLTFNISGGATTVVTFTATANTGTVNGTVTGATVGTVSCVSGSTTVTANIGAIGGFSCTGVLNSSSVVVTPTVPGFTVSPLSANVAVNGNTVTIPNFTATAIPTYTATFANSDGCVSWNPTSGTVNSGATASSTPTLSANCTNLMVNGIAFTSGAVYTTAALTSNVTVTASGTTKPGILNIKKSLRAVYDADLLATSICFSIPTQGTGFHIVVTRADKGNQGESVTLNDVGNDCDATPNDGTFSGQLTVKSVPDTPAYDGMVGKLLFGVQLIDNKTKAVLASPATELRVVNVALKGTTKTTQVGAFTIASNALFYKTPYGTLQQDVAKSMYQVVKDDNDFLVFSTSRSDDISGSGSQDYFTITIPEVNGTGISNFVNNSALYGSNMVLGIDQNSDVDASDQEGNHEIGIHGLGCCHATNSILPLSADGDHLNGALFDFPDGTMGPETYLVKQADGTGDYKITLVTNAALSPLAKYFGRVISASAVPPMCAAFGYTGSTAVGAIVPASAVTCFTIQDVIAQFGPISPTRTTPIIIRVADVNLYEDDGQLNDAFVTSSNWMSAFSAGNTACPYDTTVPPLPCSFSGIMGGDATLDTTVHLKQ